MSVKQTGVVDVAVADGSPLVLTALSEFFDRNREFSLIATTATAEAFLDTVQRVPVDVAVIDWQLPRLGGEQVIRTLKSLGSVVKVVVYGALDPPDVVRRAMAAGAAGFAPVPTVPRSCWRWSAVSPAARCCFPISTSAISIAIRSMS